MSYYVMMCNSLICCFGNSFIYFKVQQVSLTNQMFKKQENNIYDDFFKIVGQKKDQGNINQKRLKKLLIKKKQDDDQDESQEKIGLKMHKFREDIRRQQREMIQHNHEFIKISANLKATTLNEDRFEIPLDSNKFKMKEEKDRVIDGEKNLKAPVRLNEKQSINLSTITTLNLQMKPIYDLNPLKKQSYEISPVSFKDPQYQYFFFSEADYGTLNLKQKFNNIYNENLHEVKEQIHEIMYYTDFFDVIQFMYEQNKDGNKKSGKQKQNEEYPQQLLEVAKSIVLKKIETLEEDFDDQFNCQQLKIYQNDITQRICDCQLDDLAQASQSIYFADKAQFKIFKELRKVQFKQQKVYTQDFIIKTDVKKIISSEKVYVINIIEEIKMLIKLSQINQEAYLYENIYQKMKSKIDEYLRLICGYTKSTLLIRYNVIEPYEKIHQFIKKCIIYGKQYRQPEPWVIEKYPILELWYQFPEKFFGFKREQIHETLYSLELATIELQKKIQHYLMYKGLKQKKINRNYNPKN